MKIKLNIITKLAAILTFTFLFSLQVSANDEMYSKTVTVKYSGGSKGVRVIYVDLNNPNIKIQTKLANNKVGTAAPLSDIVNLGKTDNVKSIAGINTNFFDAYEGTNQVFGPVISNGEILHKDYHYYRSAGFDNNHNLFLDTMTIPVGGELIDKETDSTYNWSGMGVNNTIGNYNTIFTSYYGNKTPKFTGVALVARNNIIVEIGNEQAPIYGDGFTVVFPNSSTIPNSISIGDTITFEHTINNYENIQTIFSGGPRLVVNNQIIMDYNEDSFSNTDSYITKSAMRGFVGITSDNKLVMANVSGVSIPETAEIAKNMGLINAVSTDGGASAGLYLNGKYVQKPGRDIASALVVMVEENLISEVDYGLQVIDEIKDLSLPVLTKDNTTFYPFSQCMNLLGAETYWIKDTNTSVGRLNGNEVEFSGNSNTYYVNGQAKKLDNKLTPFVYKDRMYVPIRYAAESLGFNVNWDGNTKTIIIN